MAQEKRAFGLRAHRVVMPDAFDPLSFRLSAAPVEAREISQLDLRVDLTLDSTPATLLLPSGILALALSHLSLGPADLLALPAADQGIVVEHLLDPTMVALEQMTGRTITLHRLGKLADGEAASRLAEGAVLSAIERNGLRFPFALAAPSDDPLMTRMAALTGTSMPPAASPTSPTPTGATVLRLRHNAVTPPTATLALGPLLLDEADVGGLAPGDILTLDGETATGALLTATGALPVAIADEVATVLVSFRTATSGDAASGLGTYWITLCDLAMPAERPIAGQSVPFQFDPQASVRLIRDRDHAVVATGQLADVGGHVGFSCLTSGA